MLPLCFIPSTIFYIKCMHIFLKILITLLIQLIQYTKKLMIWGKIGMRIPIVNYQETIMLLSGLHRVCLSLEGLGIVTQIKQKCYLVPSLSILTFNEYCGSRSKGHSDILLLNLLYFSKKKCSRPTLDIMHLFPFWVFPVTLLVL